MKLTLNSLPRCTTCGMVHCIWPASHWFRFWLELDTECCFALTLVSLAGWRQARCQDICWIRTIYRMRDKWRTIKGILLPLMTERSSHRAREQDDEVVKKNLQKYLKSALTRAKPQHAQYSHFDNSEALIYARTLINISIHFPHKNVCGTRVSRVYPNNIPHILGRSLKPYLVVGSIRKI